MSLNQFRRLIGLVALLWSGAAVRAELRVAKPVIELGEVRGGQRLRQQFELTNAGKDVIDIVEVRRGCGCLAPRLTERRLQPGATTTLHVELRTLGQADGPHTWNAEVVYRSGGEMKTLPLALRGTVRNEVVVQPAILALHVDRNTSKEITLVDRRARPLRVLSAEPRSPALKVAGIVRDGNTTRVVLSAEVEALPPGRYEGMVFIFTDDRDYEELQIPVTVTKGKRAAVQVVPERPQLRMPAGAAAGSTLLRLRSLTGAAVRVADVKTDEPAAKLTWVPGPGADATVRVQLPRSAAATALELRVALEGDESLVIPLAVIRE